MARGIRTANNSDLAPVPDLFVASASCDLRSTIIQWHISFINIIDSVGTLHLISPNQCVFQQVKVIVSLVKQSILTLAVCAPTDGGCLLLNDPFEIFSVLSFTPYHELWFLPNP